MIAADARTVVGELLRLTAEDTAKLDAINDPEVLALLLRDARAYGARIDRSTLGQVEAYLSTISASDWLALLKAAIPLLLPLL